MRYKISYMKKTGTPFPFSETQIVRILTEFGPGIQLTDGNSGTRIRTFPNLGDAMNWIDEERRGV